MKRETAETLRTRRVFKTTKTDTEERQKHRLSQASAPQFVDFGVVSSLRSSRALRELRFVEIFPKSWLGENQGQPWFSRNKGLSKNHKKWSRYERHDNRHGKPTITFFPEKRTIGITNPHEITNHNLITTSHI